MEGEETSKLHTEAMAMTTVDTSSQDCKLGRVGWEQMKFMSPISQGGECALCPSEGF